MTESFQDPGNVDRNIGAQREYVEGSFKPLPKSLPRARFVRVSLAAIIMVGLATGLCVLVTKNTELQAAELKTKASATFIKSTMVLAAAKHRPMRGKNVNSEPSGIALSADSMATSSDDAPVSSVAQGKKDAAKPKIIKAASQHVQISKPTESTEPQADEDEPNESAPKLDAESLAKFDKALEKDANDQKAWNGKLAALQQSNSPESIGEIQKMIELRPQSGAAYATLAQAFAQQGDNESSSKALHRAVELDPSNKNYRLSLAVLYDRMGQDNEAMALYKQVPKPLPYAAQKRLDYLISRAKP